MAICKLCKEDKKLIDRSHIIPEFFYKELYDENHRIRKFEAIEMVKKEKKISKPPKGEYEGGLLCFECDGKRIGNFESYISKIINNGEIPEVQKPSCQKIVNGTGVEFTRVENVDYKFLKLFLLSIIWRASISKRPTFKEVALGPYEEKIRKQLYNSDSSSDNDIAIVVMSWHNDDEMPTDIICQPVRHKQDGKTYYSIVLNGFIILFFISENSINENLIPFRLKEDNTFSIIHLAKGRGMEFLVNYTGALDELKKIKSS